MGAFSYSVHAIYIAAAIDVSGGEVQATVVSIIYGASFLGTFSPVLGGMISDSYGIPIAFLFSGSLVLLSAVTLFWVKMPNRSV